MWDLKTSSVLFGIPHIIADPLLCFATNSNEGVCGGVSTKIFKFLLDFQSSSGSVSSSCEIPMQGIQCVSVRSDKKIFATGGWDHRVRVFSFEKFLPLAILPFHKESVQAIDFSTNDNLLVSGGKDAKIALWNIY